MVEIEKEAALREFRHIPGVGKSIALDLWNLGFRRVEELRDQDAEDLYHRFCLLQGTKVDRCMLYVLRCAVYYATTEQHDPALLKWWNWKDVPTTTV